MGIVKTQVYKNTLMLYIGMGIGYVNTVLLFPAVIGDEKYGFYNLLISISVLYSLVASMGVPGMLAKYFPFYRTDDGQHNSFIHWMGLIGLAGFIATTVLYLIFKPAMVAVYSEKSPLFVSYYYYLIPLALFVVIFNFLEMTGRVVYKTIYSNFLQFVLLRLGTTIMLIMMTQKWLTFDGFIVGYIAINGLISLLLLISLICSGNFSYRLSDTRFTTIKKKEVLNFGFFTLLSSAIYVLLQKIDTLMLSSMAGDSIQGVYSWYFSIAMVISVPSQALSRTTYAIVSDSWRSKNMAAISDVYSKTSTIQMLIGCLLFIGIFINKENLYALARNKDFTDPKYISLFVVIGMGFLADITGGLNGHIIITSHKYKLMFVLIFFSCTLCVLLNYFLIPIYQGLGAALAYAITIVGLNFCSWLYVKYKFKMQPFTSKHLVIIAIAILSFFVGKYFWQMPNVFLDIIVRSSITAIIYIGLAYFFKISLDVNDKIDSTLAKFIK